MPDSPALPASNTEIEIRQARPADVPALAALEASVFASDRLSRRSLAALARSRSARLLVACRGPVPVGYALVLIRRTSRHARLYSLAVDPAWSGHGLGARLLRAAEAAAAESGAETLRLEVREDNSAALRLYERSGYRPIGRRADYYDDGAPALRLALALARPGSGRARGGRTRPPLRHAA